MSAGVPDPSVLARGAGGCARGRQRRERGRREASVDLPECMLSLQPVHGQARRRPETELGQRANGAGGSDGQMDRHDVPAAGAGSLCW